MPLRLVQLRFGELKEGAKFLGKPPGGTKRIKLVKSWDNRAKPETGTLLYEFKPNDMVYVWRWSF